MIPQDGAMLYSFINMKLRDEYPSLDALCDDLDISRAEIEEKLAALGYFYDKLSNRFA